MESESESRSRSRGNFQLLSRSRSRSRNVSENRIRSWSRSRDCREIRSRSRNFPNLSIRSRSLPLNWSNFNRRCRLYSCAHFSLLFPLGWKVHVSARLSRFFVFATSQSVWLNYRRRQYARNYGLHVLHSHVRRAVLVSDVMDPWMTDSNIVTLRVWDFHLMFQLVHYSDRPPRKCWQSVSRRMPCSCSHCTVN